MNKKIIILLLAFMVALVVGYALFSSTLNINGTTTAKGDFKMEILNASVTNEVGSSGATANVINNGKALEITVPHLEYPGAYVEVTYDIKNSGTIDALYDGYNITGETDRIKSLFNISTMYYAPNDESTETFRIYWDENNNSEEEETANIVLEINYTQVDDKNTACTKLKEMQTTLDECSMFIITGEENCPSNKFDLNHDGWIDGNDGSYISEIVDLKMQCSSN